MRCHGSKTHSSSQETPCLQNSKHPRPTAPASSNHIWPSVQPQDPVCVCAPRWARCCDEHLQPPHEQHRGLPRGCHGKQACEVLYKQSLNSRYTYQYWISVSQNYCSLCIYIKPDVDFGEGERRRLMGGDDIIAVPKLPKWTVIDSQL